VTKLRARVKKLEAELDAKDKKDHDEDLPDRRRIRDSLNDGRDSKLDAADRVLRGMTLASVEFVRLFADSVSSFGSDVIRRNESRVGGGRSVRSLVRRLPEDIADGFSNAIDLFTDIPARTADRYSKVYREGEKTDRNRDRDSSARK